MWNLKFQSTQEEIYGVVYNIQNYCIQDGPGIRTTVFLKGCPLRCLWCSNPESQKNEKQLLFVKSLCEKCYKCAKACPRNAISKHNDGRIEINYSMCTNCGNCVEVCSKEALMFSGNVMSTEQVICEVKKDGLLYRNSGGGITISGGEPLAQPQFVKRVFEKCQKYMIHTCIDTCGYAQWEVIEPLLPFIDLFLYDIKHMNSSKHKELTGVGNELILKNLCRIVEKGKDVTVRFPLIPQCNDSNENINELGRFVKHMGISELNVLPYHKLGASKYASLGEKYKLEHLHNYSKEHVEEIVAKLNSLVGEKCVVKVI